MYIGKHLIDVEYSLKGTYKIKDGTLSIAKEAIAGCEDLVEITIPASVEFIGDHAIGYKYLEYFENVEKITNGLSIKCFKDTAGEKYAKENGLLYTLISSLDEDKVELKPGSSYKAESGILSGVVPNTSFESFKAQFSFDVKVVDNKGSEVTSGVIGTGYTVSSGDDSVTVVVQGDTDGNGKIDSTDYIAIKRHILGIRSLG